VRSKPLACSLGTPDLEARKQEIRTQLLPAVQETRDLDDGIALRFPSEPERLTKLAEFVAVERDCCSFLRLEIVAEPAAGPIWLFIRGPGGAKEFLAAELGITGRGASA